MNQRPSRNLALSVGPWAWLAALAAALLGPVGVSLGSSLAAFVALAAAASAAVLVVLGWIRRSHGAFDAAAVATVVALTFGMTVPSDGLVAALAVALLGVMAASYYASLWGARVARARRQGSLGGAAAALGAVRIVTVVAVAAGAAFVVLLAPQVLAPWVSDRWPHSVDASAGVMVALPALAVVLLATGVTLLRGSVDRVAGGRPPKALDEDAP